MAGAIGQPFTQRGARRPAERHDPPAVALAVADDQLARALSQAHVVDLERRRARRSAHRSASAAARSRGRGWTRADRSRAAARAAARATAPAPPSGRPRRAGPPARAAPASPAATSRPPARGSPSTAQAGDRPAGDASRRAERGGRRRPPAQGTRRARRPRPGARAARPPSGDRPSACARRAPGGEPRAVCVEHLSRRAHRGILSEPSDGRSPRPSALSDARGREVPQMAPCRNAECALGWMSTCHHRPVLNTIAIPPWRSTRWRSCDERLKTGPPVPTVTPIPRGPCSPRTWTPWQPGGDDTFTQFCPACRQHNPVGRPAAPRPERPGRRRCASAGTVHERRRECGCGQRAPQAHLRATQHRRDRSRNSEYANGLPTDAVIGAFRARRR